MAQAHVKVPVRRPGRRLRLPSRGTPFLHGELEPQEGAGAGAWEWLELWRGALEDPTFPGLGQREPAAGDILLSARTESTGCWGRPSVCPVSTWPESRSEQSVWMKEPVRVGNKQKPEV